MPEMHVMARLTVAELAKRGVALDPVQDFHHLVELDRLAREAAGASIAWKSARAFFPTVGIANVTLRRLSIGGREFFNREMAQGLDLSDRATELAALAWLMAHSDDPARHLWPLAGRHEALRDAIQTWVRTVGASWAELQEAVTSLLQGGEGGANRLDEPDADTAPDYGAICAALAEHFGRDPQWWFWQAPEALAAEMMEKLAERRDAEERAAARAEGVARAPNPGARWVRARAALSFYKERILAEKLGGSRVPDGGRKAADEGAQRRAAVPSGPQMCQQAAPPRQPAHDRPAPSQNGQPEEPGAGAPDSFVVDLRVAEAGDEQTHDRAGAGEPVLEHGGRDVHARNDTP